MRLALTLVGVPALAGCASLPRTNLPVCDRLYEQECISSIAAERDYEWEAINVCARPTATRLYPCYVFAGARDGRQLYRYRLDH